MDNFQVWSNRIAAVIGAFAVSFIEPLLPYALSFAAGAMIFVVAGKSDSKLTRKRQ